MEEKSIHRLAWEQLMISKYGSVEAGQEEMRRRSVKSKGVPKRTVFKDNPELARQAGKKGALKRWENKDENN